jgi:hypothetical protein
MFRTSVVTARRWGIFTPPATVGYARRDENSRAADLFARATANGKGHRRRSCGTVSATGLAALAVSVHRAKVEGVLQQSRSAITPRLLIE